MARIRSIKPEFPHSESVGRMSRDARLCFIQLWTVADDSGRLRGNSRMLASLLFPYDSDAAALIDGWLDELEREGCIRRYEVDGNKYIEMPNWLKHQKIDKPTASKLPSFDDRSREVARPREASSEEGKGEEGKGEDQGKDQDQDQDEPTSSASLQQPPSMMLTLQTTKSIEEEAVDLWNEMAERLWDGNAVQKLTASRRTALKRRLADSGGIEGWKAALAKVEASPGLRGEANGHGHPGWRCTFDFLISERSFTKVMEGSYDNWGAVPAKATPGDQIRRALDDLDHLVGEPN